MDAISMDEVNRALSARSQHTAGERALDGAFLTRSGWVDEQSHPHYTEQSEKITITWRPAPREMCVKGKNKKMAVIVSPILRNVFSLSGWTNDHPHLPIIDSHLWTSAVRTEAAKMEMQLPQTSWDQAYKDGWYGKYHASHAEAKLMALYLDFNTKQPEAVQYLASATNWDSRVLDIDVSAGVCRGCRKIARSSYEKHNIMVNFTVEGMVEYPHCKNFYCDREILDGLRVFCDTCQTQINHPPTVCVDLPQMNAAQFAKLLQESAKRSAAFGKDEDMIYHILEAISKIPDRGLHLYHEGAVSEMEVTVILSTPDKGGVNSIIDECVENILKKYIPDGRSWLTTFARMAIINFINDLAIPGLCRAFGNFDTFPWKITMSQTRKEPPLCEYAPTTVHDISQHFDLLSEVNDTQSQDHFDDNSDDSSSGINCVIDDEQEGPDTDDEVEEANATDDGDKITEGDW